MTVLSERLACFTTAQLKQELTRREKERAMGFKAIPITDPLLVYHATFSGVRLAAHAIVVAKSKTVAESDLLEQLIRQRFRSCFASGDLRKVPLELEHISTLKPAVTIVEDGDY